MMRVDGTVMTATEEMPAAARELEELGYDGVFTAETSHDPFLPITLAALETERIELAAGITVAFARNPMSTAVIGNDLQLYTKGRFILGLGSQIKPHIEKRFSMPWSDPAKRMPEFILAIRAIWAWERRRQARLPRRVLPADADDADVRPGTQPVRPPEDLPRRRRRRMTKVAGEVADGMLCTALRPSPMSARSRSRARARVGPRP